MVSTKSHPVFSKFWAKALVARVTRSQVAWLWAVSLLVASVLRLFALGRGEFLYDEGVLIVTAREWAQDSISPWISLDQPPIFTWLNGLVVQVMGSPPNAVSIRLASAIAGALTVIPLAALADLWRLGRRATFSALLLYAIAPLPVAMARFAQSDTVVALWVVTAVLASEHAIRHRRRWLLCASALFWALAFLTKYNALGVMAVYFLLRARRTPRPVLMCLLVLWVACVFLLAFGYWDRLVVNFGGWVLRGGGLTTPLQQRLARGGRLLFLGTLYTVGPVGLALLILPYLRRDRTTLAVPLAALSMVVLLFQGRYFTRYFELSVPWLCLAVGTGIEAWRMRKRGYVGLLLLILLSLVPLYGCYFDYLRIGPLYAPMAESVQELAGTGDTILVADPALFPYLAVRYTERAYRVLPQLRTRSQEYATYFAPFHASFDMITRSYTAHPFHGYDLVAQLGSPAGNEPPLFTRWEGLGAGPISGDNRSWRLVEEFRRVDERLLVYGRIWRGE